MTLKQNNDFIAAALERGLLIFITASVLLFVIAQNAQAQGVSVRYDRTRIEYDRRNGTSITVATSGVNPTSIYPGVVDLKNANSTVTALNSPVTDSTDNDSTDDQNSQDYKNGSSSIGELDAQFLKSNPDVSFLGKDIRDKEGRPIRGFVNPALVRGASPVGTMYPPTPAAQMGWNVESNVTKEMYYSGLNQLNGFNGNVNSDLKTYAQELQAGNFMARTLQYPSNVANQARAQLLATANAAGNAMGDMAKGQSASAISYCSSFMRNFTAEEGNRWNTIRNGLFVPIAILLLLPGAILTQIKAMVSAGNPALGDMNPFDGILRSVVAIFLIPATFLVVNYGIDFSNSIVASIAGTYQSVMGRNMYKDALGAEFRAFPVRSPKENQNTGLPKKWPVKKINDVRDYEDMYVTNKIVDPTNSEYIVPKNKTDEAMPAGAVAARELTFGTNAALSAAWNILCAFQMAYLAYLFFVGPIVAALWVYPIKQFREALPNWVEGVCTVCFWSLFWNTAILLMACFKGVDESGTMITTALNFLATSSVKYAFDFAGLVKAAGQQAAQKALQKGGAKGGAGGAGAAGSKGGTYGDSTNSSGKPSSSNTTGTNAGSTNKSSNSETSTQSAPLMPSTPVNSFVPANGKSSTNLLDFQMPPLSFKVDPRVNSQSAQLENYGATCGVRDGKQTDLLMTGTTTYALNEDGQLHTAAMNSNRISTPFSSPLSSDNKSHALTLRSQMGTLLLENDGRTLLVPRADSAGFNSYSLEPGAASGDFDLGNSRHLTLRNDAAGTHVDLDNGETKNGKIAEQFTICVDSASKGFSIGHDVHGETMGRTFVSSNGSDVVYTNIDQNGNLTDRETIAYNNANGLNRITTEYFDPSKAQAQSQPIGTAVRDYDAQGNYTATYYKDSSNVVLATATHVLTQGGGFQDTVTNGRDVVSVQNAVKNQLGGFDISTQRYKDGIAVDVEMVSYDASTNVVQASPAVLAKLSFDQDSCVTSVLPNPSTVSNNSVVSNPSTVLNNSVVSNTSTLSNSSVVSNPSTVSQFLTRISNTTNGDQYSVAPTSQTTAVDTPNKRGLAQVFSTTRPVVNPDTAPQAEIGYTW